MQNLQFCSSSHEVGASIRVCLVCGCWLRKCLVSHSDWNPNWRGGRKSQDTLWSQVRSQSLLCLRDLRLTLASQPTPSCYVQVRRSCHVPMYKPLRPPWDMPYASTHMLPIWLSFQSVLQTQSLPGPDLHSYVAHKNVNQNELRCLSPLENGLACQCQGFPKSN